MASPRGGSGPTPTDQRSSTGSADQRSSTTSTGERLADWLLLGADRLALAGVLTFGVFVLLLVLGSLDVIAFTNDDSVTRMAGGMIAGTFTLVTVVISINQLILSREFVTAGEFRDRLDGVMAFRNDVASLTGVATSPAEPTRFLALLVEAIREHATALRDGVSDHPDDEIRGSIDRFVTLVVDQTDSVDRSLSGSTFGTFDALQAAIGYDDALQLYGARVLRAEYAEELPADVCEECDALIDALEAFNVARAHFKSTYVQRELAHVSRLVLATGVPAVLAAIVLGLLYADVTGATIPNAYLPPVSTALITVVFAPLSIVAAYGLRAATIARRTASVGPMLPGVEGDEVPFTRGDVTPDDE